MLQLHAPTLRRVALVAAVVLAAVPAAAETRVRASAVPLHPDDPARETVGGLRYRGGLALASDDRRFGGFSGMEIDPEGRSLRAVSDQGAVLVAELRYDASGRLDGVGEASLDRLLGADGRPLVGKLRSDAESMTALDDQLVVAFEHEHRLLRYGPDGRPPVLLPAPPDLGDAPSNAGVEALVTLADGRLLALTESFLADDGRGVRGWLRDRGGWAPLTYATTEGYKPTGAARLPDGDLVVVQRGFLGAAVRIARIRAADVAPGAHLTDVEVARWQVPLTIDNFECIAARRGPSGETLVYLLSDDNFRRHQRTILMMFELLPDADR